MAMESNRIQAATPIDSREFDMKELLTCPKCGEHFPQNTLFIRLSAIILGAAIGAFTGTGIGLIGLFVGALIFAFFGGVLGAVVAGFAISKLAKCPKCGELVVTA